MKVVIEIGGQRVSSYEFFHKVYDSERLADEIIKNPAKALELAEMAKTIRSKDSMTEDANVVMYGCIHRAMTGATPIVALKPEQIKSVTLGHVKIESASEISGALDTILARKDLAKKCKTLLDLAILLYGRWPTLVTVEEK